MQKKPMMNSQMVMKIARRMPVEHIIKKKLMKLVAMYTSKTERDLVPILKEGGVTGTCSVIRRNDPITICFSRKDVPKT